MSVLSSAAVKNRMLKIKFGELVARSGGLEAAAAFCRVSKSTLARYASLVAADAECFAPVDVVRDLEALVGDPIVTATLCTMADGTFFALPAAAPGRGDWLSMLAKGAREHGELAQVLCKMIADGVAEPHEAEGAITEIDDNIRVLVAMRAAAMSIVEGK